MKLPERFWTQVCRTAQGPADGCWVWPGWKHKDGYGVISDNDKDYLAHRVSWEIHNGPIPEGGRVLHRCDNPPCVNPAHLFLGTQQDNIADMVSKGRQHRPIGTINPKAKLNPDLASEIRGKYVPGNIRLLAKEYGVATSTIWRVVTQESWAKEATNGKV